MSKIKYSYLEPLGEDGALFLEEIPVKSGDRRKAKFLCGECKQNTFEAQITMVKNNYRSGKCIECSKQQRIKTISKYQEGTKIGPVNTLFKKRLPDRKGLFKCSYCGKDFITEISSVGTGLTKSCGCLHSKTSKEKTFIDITGQRFGKLVAKYEVGSTKDGRSIWYCECDCGGHKEVVGKLLRNGHTHSCGCSNSKGNVKVKQCLEQLQLSFEEEKVFKDCYTSKGYPYYFDFYLPDYNCCIEYDGKQHYVGWPVDSKRGSVEYIQKNDQIKTDYCKN